MLRLTWLMAAALVTLGAGAGAAAADAVTLRYYGQSFFLLTTGGGTRVAIDPFGTIGLPMPSGVEADAVLITHEHGDHNNAGLIGGKARVFRGLTTNPPGWNTIRERAGDVLIYSVPAFHDDAGGTTGRGFNTIFVLEVAGLRIAHLGDLGQAQLTEGQLRALGRIDVLLIPVGGAPFTIGAAEATRITDQLNPRVVIPMHYKTAARPQWPGSDEQPFLAGKPNVQRVGHTVTLTSATLPRERTILVMAYQ
ncbi:MAG: MBL fold metallo-hydrolase [Armatimonadota bacterium]|nr:MBL fold metallo-hydrolase [Armatimonadota bacterium]MDR7452137.1 MBL fold metallo-hydrolase [Armatimonadota bacterium]MDR7467861.1 MBL fold metallo-hydrolase [Armatimonadota bacterium]MDR7494749.1 MBL fold metallo-hydrolase [Armatimonadota bacterium]MDR7499574.1 MBL fold metallo-hydrolase [Armatimonadota bacterium]